MIAQLSGQVVQIGATSVVLDVGGVGFVLGCPPGTAADLRLGEQATLFTHLAVREDALTLYGFSSASDKEAFVLVQSVSGIGPKLALAVVSHLSAAQLRQAIVGENLLVLSGVPGIGRKTAQRLVLELKDKAMGLDDTAPATPTGSTQFQEQVVQGLIGLGYSAKDAERAWEQVAGVSEDSGTTVSALMRSALQSLAKG